VPWTLTWLPSPTSHALLAYITFKQFPCLCCVCFRGMISIMLMLIMPENTGINIMLIMPENTSINIMLIMPENTGINIMLIMPENTGINIMLIMPENTGNHYVIAAIEPC